MIEEKIPTKVTCILAGRRIGRTLPDQSIGFEAGRLENRKF